MWTKLLWMTKSQAFDVRYVNKRKHFPQLSMRRRMEIKKLFRGHNLPWIFSEPLTKINPRHLPLKDDIRKKEKKIRLDSIKKNLAKQDDDQLAHRQTQINRRRLRGLDFVIKMIIKGQSHQTSEKEQWKMNKINKKSGDEDL